MTAIRVLVPASTANLGPGFDCLGLALGLHNTVEMTALDAGFELAIEGEGANRLRTDRGNLVMRAADALWDRAGHKPGGLRVKCINGVPLGSGLGSSAAAAVGGLAAANALIGSPLSKMELLKLAHAIEGHPDNAAAALFGGLTIVSAGDDDVMIDRLDVPPLTVVIALPDVRLSTHDARKALPRSVPLTHAVFNIGRALLVARALNTGDYDLLKRAMDDRLHQPYRRKLIPGFDAAEQAAREAGAAAVALSGAGPSLAAFAPDRHEEIAQAMKVAFESRGIACRTFVLPADREGVQIREGD
ncbi:MAG TPA: homoserine kinase [Anaerolineae bacterium]